MTVPATAAAAAALPLSAEVQPRRVDSDEAEGFNGPPDNGPDEADDELMAEAEADDAENAEQRRENDCGGEADDELEEQLDLRLPKMRRNAEALGEPPSPLQQQQQQQQQQLQKQLLPTPTMPPHSRAPPPMPPTSLPLPPRDFLAQRDFLLAQQEFFAHHHQQLLAREAAAAAAAMPFLHARPGGLPLPLGLGRPLAPPPPPQSMSVGQMPPPPPASSSALLPPTSGMLGRSDGEDEQRGGTPESLTPPPSEKGGGLGLGEDGSPEDSEGGHHWTFEEQFKQLYELSEEPKRKQFLDDLFAFMQRRGTPVNRIPIMAKQVLDLYELFRLVVSKGGLVEVINKKLWREITKGLNLPSSITSAAFTLRTQYMKYLYPYECEKLKLSSPGELQAAIDGNRREGRRPNYPAFECGPSPGGLPPLLTYHSSMVSGKAMSDRDFACLTPPVLRATPGDERHHQQHQPHHHHHHALHQQQNLPDASPKDLSSAGVAAVAKNFNGDSGNAGVGGSLKRSCSGSDATGAAPFLPTGAADHQPPAAKRPTANGNHSSAGGSDARSPPPPHPASVGSGGGAGLGVQLPFPAGMPPFPGLPLPSASGGIRIAGHHGGHLGLPDSSVVISMEINGLMYHGVLFAQPKRH